MMLYISILVFMDINLIESLNLNILILMICYVNSLKKTSPNAILFWSSTTPVLVKDGYEIDVNINPIIERCNKKACKIMIDKNVYIIDLYSLMMKNLHYSAKDKFHWMIKEN